jgi:hypothetical protein
MAMILRVSEVVEHRQNGAVLESPIMNNSIKHIICGALLALMGAAAQADPSTGFLKVRDGGRQVDGQLWLLQKAPQDERKSNAEQNDGGGNRRQERLSPEERRQLRRDIQDAGRQIYPPKRK